MLHAYLVLGKRDEHGIPLVPAYATIDADVRRGRWGRDYSLMKSCQPWRGEGSNEPPDPVKGALDLADRACEAWT
jgi:hypothetical protein